MTIIFANNAISKLAQPLLSGQTQLTLQAGTGSLFPSPSGGDYFKLTIEDRRTQQIEITHCTGRSGDVLTVVRAQENMSALNFSTGATVSNRFTRDTPDAILAEVPDPNPLYLGAFASAPTATEVGQSYFNLLDEHVYYWTGGAWVDPIGSGNITSASGVFILQDISGSFNGVTTQFNLRYTDYAATLKTPDVVISEQFIVFIDGVAQRPGTDYLIPSLGTIEFTSAPSSDATFSGVWIALTNGLPGSGTGDMTRAVYDTDNDGVVDFAESVQFSGVQQVPTTRFLGRLTAGTGAAEALSAAQMKTALDIDAKLDLAGGTMTGPIDMGGEEIVSPVLQEIGIASGAASIVAGVVTLDFAVDGDAPLILLTTSVTSLSITGWPPSGVLGKMTIFIQQDGTGSHAFTLPTSSDNWFWANGIVPTVTDTANKTDIFVAMSRDNGATVFATTASQNH